MANTFKDAINTAYDILDGTVKEVLGYEEELSQSRLEICMQCPIFIMREWGPTCDSKKWINKEDKVSDGWKKDYVKGCGCRLKAKTRVQRNHCVIGKW